MHMYWCGIRRVPEWWLTLLLVLVGCSAGGDQYIGAVRGMTRWEVLRYDGDVPEAVSIEEDQSAGRSRLPVTVKSKIQRGTIPPTLWQELETVRAQWCTERPAAMQSELRHTTDIGVGFRCSRFSTPSFYLPIDAVPPALMALWDVLPPEPPAAST